MALQHCDANLLKRVEIRQDLVVLPRSYWGIEHQAHQLIRFGEIKFVSQAELGLCLDRHHALEEFRERQERLASSIEHTPNLIELIVR